MRSFQYHHEVLSGYCVCLELSSVLGLSDLTRTTVEQAILSWDRPLNLMVGIAKCHPDDRYTKDKAREISVANLKLTSFQLLTAMVDPDKPGGDAMIVVLHSNDAGTKLNINLSISKKSDKVRLVDSFLWKW